MSDDLSFSQRLAQLAVNQPDAPAVTVSGTTTDFARLHEAAGRFAARMTELGVGVGDFVTIAEPNSAEFLISAVACWLVGAVPQPVSFRLPGLELKQIVELADSKLVIGAQLNGRHCLPSGAATDSVSQSFAPFVETDRVSPHWKAPTSGGSTGRPKLIVSGDPSIHSKALQGLGHTIGARHGWTVVMPGPLYHNGPFIWSCLTVLAGGHIALLPRFDAEATLRNVAEYRAQAIYLVPTMMQRIWKLDDEVKFGYDLSSLEVAFHLAEPCPAWLKEAWLNWIGPEALFELYGGTEGQMFTVISGPDWLEHRGSVGTPISGDIKICDADGNELPPGEEGEVWMRWTNRDTPTYYYVGDEPEARDGWETLGDMGWRDDDGFLYLSDRRKDMILVGGANVYPAEVEAAIGAHPDVLTSAVIGLPDEDKGHRVHAIVQRVDSTDLDEAGLRAFLGERLVSYKIPRTIEWSTEPLRDEAGKVRRGALRDERAGS